MENPYHDHLKSIWGPGSTTKVKIDRADTVPIEGYVEGVLYDGCNIYQATSTEVVHTFIAYRDIRGIHNTTPR